MIHLASSSDVHPSHFIQKIISPISVLPKGEVFEHAVEIDSGKT